MDQEALNTGLKHGEMKKKKLNKITISQGTIYNWFVKYNDELIACFWDHSDAELFCEAKWPEFKNEEQ